MGVSGRSTGRTAPGEALLADTELRKKVIQEGAVSAPPQDGGQVGERRVELGTHQFGESPLGQQPAGSFQGIAR